MGQSVSNAAPHHQRPRSRSNSRNVTDGPGGADDTDSDSDSHSVGALTPSGSTKKKKMAFFRRQSDAAKRRMDHQLYLALILSDNWLSAFSNGKMSDLKTIRVLDLHCNEIKTLPSDIGELSNLQVLNLTENRMIRLPEEFSHLQHLQSLYLKGNKLKHFPPPICGLHCLRLLDISENEITTLPPQLCNVRTLETLIVDVHKITSPPSEVCKKGTEDIMKNLCAACGTEYLPPSNFLLNVLDPPTITASSTNTSINKALKEEEDLMEKRRLERIEMERQLAQSIAEQTELAAVAAQQKQNFIMAVTEDQNKLDKELEELSHKKEGERQKLVAYLQEVEEGTSSLIKKMLEMNEKARKAEELLEAVEKERMEAEEWFTVRSEEIQNLRKEEILRNMKAMLAETEAFEKVRSNFTDNKDNMMRQALENEQAMSQNQVESIMYRKEIDQMMLMDMLQKQEQLQKEAFEALQLQRDAKHQRISSQISLIEEELASLTALEIQRRELRTEEEVNIIAEKRIALIEVLSQLLHEQEARQEELKKRLEEMEERREDEQTDYWLVQFQRLLDRKPQALIDREHNLEIAVVTILQDSGAEEYIPLFARHRISIETLLQITEDDLKQMGVHELGLRKSILRNIQVYSSKEGAKVPEKSIGDASKGQEMINSGKFAGRDDVQFDHPPPSAPPTGRNATIQSQVSITARGLNSECVVCLDKVSDVLFLYCGHVCVCSNCCAPLKECPLCRAQIVQVIKLTSAEP
ncbi:hypothetical protein FSP39_017332 [Pinctada imbricata]|uniref:E3 ubiquitin-protein ligase LRSAM1 n=1 Tax=Pinctada imbricata TaxID=66713 RepID=A0AA88XTB2_PINIB|nr:hypothetical protein FSP39_017332 [Pinctada imbricata]